LLHYFRINDPYRIIGLLIVLLLLYLPILIDVPSWTVPEFKTYLAGEKILQGYALYTELIDSTAPFTGWLFAVINFIFGESLTARHILAFMILFIEAVMLGIIYIDKKGFPDSSFIPSLIFGILCAFSYDTVSLSGDLAGTFFLILALNSIYKELEFREENYEMALKSGFFIGIASLFEFSFTLYVFAALIIFILYARTNGRKILLHVLGYGLPHLFLLSIYYIKGGVSELWTYFYLPNLAFGHEGLIAHSHLLLLMAIPAFFFVASLVALNRESRFTKYQSQVLQAMFFWTIFSILQVYYSKSLRPHSFIPAMVGISFFISHFFLIVMRRRFAGLAFWIFLAGIASVSYLSRYGYLNQGAYEQLTLNKAEGKWVGKKIVVLNNDVSSYQGASMSTPFLNWELSQEIFQNPGYYEHITRVYEGFKTDSPDVIVDPSNVMKPFLETIPELRKQYRKSAEGYQKIGP
jgi:hypothetical protein